MRCRLIALMVALGVAFAVGCGGGEAGSTAKGPAAGPSGTVPSDPIARVVYDFFDAVRQGQTAQANRLLTPLSLQMIAKHDMSVTPPSSPTARFQVGAVRAVKDGHAVVELTWTDVNGDGKPFDDDILCELRVSDGQWRICGMAQDLGPGQRMVLDFESLEGIAPPATTATQTTAPGAPGAPTSAPAATTEAAPGKEIALDPFQQPVQR